MKQYPFSQKYRIQKPKEFSLVFAQGKKFQTKHLTGISISNDLPYFRLGISIGKRYGKANKRNVFKRLIRESFRTEPLRFTQGFDLVILPFHKEKILDFAIFQQELQQIMQAIVNHHQQTKKTE